MFRTCCISGGPYNESDTLQHHLYNEPLDHHDRQWLHCYPPHRHLQFNKIPGIQASLLHSLWSPSVLWNVYLAVFHVWHNQTMMPAGLKWAPNFSFPFIFFKIGAERHFSHLRSQQQTPRATATSMHHCTSAWTSESLLMRSPMSSIPFRTSTRKAPGYSMSVWPAQMSLQLIF